jgi:Protein of unknown function (DUF4232)
MHALRRVVAARRGVCAVAIAAGLAAAVFAVPAQSASTARCATSGLVVWLDTQGDGAAGSIYYQLKFTNLSGHSCTLLGYPGVSGVDLAGHQLGSPARRDPSLVKVIHLANDATASATLRVVEAGNFPSSACHMTNAAGVRVYPPNQTAAKVVPFPFAACSRTGPVYLSVQAVTAH